MPTRPRSDGSRADVDQEHLARSQCTHAPRTVLYPTTSSPGDKVDHAIPKTQPAGPVVKGGPLGIAGQDHQRPLTTSPYRHGGCVGQPVPTKSCFSENPQKSGSASGTTA